MEGDFVKDLILGFCFGYILADLVGFPWLRK